jgi:hypothetical protein
MEEGAGVSSGIHHSSFIIPTSSFLLRLLLRHAMKRPQAPG